MYRKSSLFCLWNLALVLEASTTTGGSPRKYNYSAVIMFGDSIADTGNNNYLLSFSKCNFPPYVIAQELGIKELLPAYINPSLKSDDFLTGVSFASGGSGYDPFTCITAAVISLPEQLIMFKEYKERVKRIIGEEKANDLISNAFFGIISSSNDIANTYFDSQIRFNISFYTDFLVFKASEFVQQLYAAGARHIIVYGAPSLGCIPSARTRAGGPLRLCSQEYNEASQIFNSKLNSSLNSLNPTLSGANLRYVDIYQPLLQLILNFTQYGFKVADRGCCGTGTVEVSFLCNARSPTCTNASEYIFWDSYHPTERAYQVIVSKVFENNDF